MNLVRAVLISLFVSLGLISCSDSNGSSFTFQRGSFTVSSRLAEVAAEIEQFVVVDVLVNGVRGRFIIDTGAEAFIVSPAFADTVGLRSVGQTNIVTVVGTSEVEVRRIDDFQFANVAGIDIDAVVVELAGFDGAIGRPLFEQVIVEFDYQSEVVRLADARLVDLQSFAAEGGFEWIEVNDLLLSELRINGEIVQDLLIDTGSAGGVHLSRSMVDGILDDSTETVTTTFSASNGAMPVTAFIADRVQLSSFELIDQLVVVQERDVAHGLIGNLFLQQFTLIVDLSRNEALLRQEQALRFELIESGEASQTEQLLQAYGVSLLP